MRRFVGEHIEQIDGLEMERVKAPVKQTPFDVVTEFPVYCQRRTCAVVVSGGNPTRRATNLGGREHTSSLNEYKMATVQL